MPNAAGARRGGGRCSIKAGWVQCSGTHIQYLVSCGLYLFVPQVQRHAPASTNTHDIQPFVAMPACLWLCCLTRVIGRKAHCSKLIRRFSFNLSVHLPLALRHLFFYLEQGELAYPVHHILLEITSRNRGSELSGALGLEVTVPKLHKIVAAQIRAMGIALMWCP